MKGTSMDDAVTVSIVIPVFNEEDNLEELIERCLRAGRELDRTFEIILVDDGSRDRSTELVTRATERHAGTVIGVLLNRNYGQHAAVMAGLAESTGEIVVTLDADLQNPPEEIPRLVKKVEEGFDVVGTVRTTRLDSPFRRFCSSVINRAVRRATGVMMHDYGCMMRAYHRRVVDAMLQCREHSTFIPILANYFASRATEIPAQHEARNSGNSKYSLWKLINLQFDLLTSMTTFPLRLLSVFGVGLASFGMGFGLLLMVMRLAYGSEWAAQGVFTLFAILFTLVGVQFIGMGLLGEYLGRIYYDVRARPRYCVERVVGRIGGARIAPPRETAEICA